VGRKKSKKFDIRDRHIFYEEAVQGVDADLDFAHKVYRKNNGRRPVSLREDFCGTASLACRWAGRRNDHLAWGIDLDEETLAWGREHHLAKLGDSAGRVTLISSDVRSVSGVKVDVALALNFSYFVFKERADLLNYYRNVHRSLTDGGVFVMDLFGGTGTMEELVENTKKGSFRAPDGTRVPAFTYVWEQARFNPVDHHILCHIHFKPRGGKTIKKAFTYDWRLWTIPEIRELLEEAGFSSSAAYIEGWDDEDDEPDGVFRKKKRFENQESWIAYVVGIK